MIPRSTWRRRPRKGGLFVQQQDEPPSPQPCPTAPQQGREHREGPQSLSSSCGDGGENKTEQKNFVTLGDKVPEVALEDAGPTPKSVLRKISARWAPSSCFSPCGAKPSGVAGDSLGAQVALGLCWGGDARSHSPKTHLKGRSTRWHRGRR